MRIDLPTQAQYSQLLQLWKTAFGDHEGFWELFLRTGFDPECCRCITLEDQTAAALCWFDCSFAGKKMAYVYAVVTHPGYRNRGLCRLLLEDTQKLLAAQGCSAVLLVPESEPLRQMYRKLGYRDCTRVSEFSCVQGQFPVPVRTIGLEEYQTLRRKFLPVGGVVQEGKNLEFLAAQAAFFTGEDFLLAAYAQDDALFGIELLGNREAAPGILRGLGFSKGQFRIPGKEKAFAMIHPLTQAVSEPTYFGFAFD